MNDMRNIENPTYLGDAVYARHVGYGIELMLNEHTAPCAVYLELEVLAALNAFHKRITHGAQQPEDENHPYVAEYAERLNGHRVRLAALLPFAQALTDAGIPRPNEFSSGMDWYSLSHEQIIAVIRILGGNWKKTPARDGKITYTRAEPIGGIAVNLYSGEPPPSCRIEEVEEDVPEQIIPAGKRIVRKLVCKE